MTKERFLTITDGIIAIIATIMVLEFRVPSHASLSGLRELAVPFLTYAISFFLILGVWFNHHELFKRVATISPRTFVFNSIWLFVMSLVPFATSWVGRSPMSLVPELFYQLLVTAWIGAFHLMDMELSRTNPELGGYHADTFPRWFLYLLCAIGLVAVWFWPPIVLIMMAILGLSVQIQFLRNVGFSKN